MKKLLMPLVVLIMAAMLSVIQYYAVTETYKDWMKTTAVLTDIQITDRRRHSGKWIHYYWKAHTKKVWALRYHFTYSNRRSFQTYHRDNQAEAVHQGPYR